MALVDARLGPGTLKLGAPLIDYSFQVANAALEPDVSEEDGTPTLATPAPPPLATVAYNLTGTAIQDFTQLPATGLQNYLMDHALQVVAFEFVPNTADGTKYAGTIQLRPMTIGGDAGVQITSDFSFPVVGAVVRTEGTGTLLRADEAKEGKK